MNGKATRDRAISKKIMPIGGRADKRGITTKPVNKSIINNISIIFNYRQNFVFCNLKSCIIQGAREIRFLFKIKKDGY